MATKTVYQYDFSGCLIGTTEADESPLEPEVFLIPARCTEVAPPTEIPEDKWPRWNGGQWDLVNRPRLEEEAADPVAKLQNFLTENPDVADLLNT